MWLPSFLNRLRKNKPVKTLSKEEREELLSQIKDYNPLSVGRLDQDHYLFSYTDSDDGRVFFLTFNINHSDWLKPYEKIARGLYIVNTAGVDGSKYLYYPSSLTESEKFRSYAQINEDWYVLFNHEYRQAFFRLSDMKISDWLQSDLYEIRWAGNDYITLSNRMHMHHYVRLNPLTHKSTAG